MNCPKRIARPICKSLSSIERGGVLCAETVPALQECTDNLAGGQNRMEREEGCAISRENEGLFDSTIPGVTEC